MSTEIKNKKLGEAGKEHRAVPSSESEIIPKLDADRTERTLKTCREAIASLPDDALGCNPQLGYPYRDELLSKIDETLEGDPWPADIELANALDRYARESGLPLEIQLCPYCPNVGYYAEGATDAPEQVQCEFCETTPNSLYRITQAIIQVTKSSEAS